MTESRAAAIEIHCDEGVTLGKTSLNSSEPSKQLSVIALAGRRVDASDAGLVRFPLRNVRIVEERIRNCFLGAVGVLVCSAACGSDLLALGVASELGIRRRVLLPFGRARFCETSVTDRPGDWAERYHRALDEVEREQDLIILGYDQADPAAYARTNAAIVDEALRIAEKEGRLAQASVVWDGKSRGSEDLTAQFLDHAREKGMPIVEILTVVF